MQLTKEQLGIVQGGSPVRLTEAGMDLVVLRADLYAQLQDRYDASPWTDDEMDQLAAEDADRLGWEGMEAYQDSNP